MAEIDSLELNIEVKENNATQIVSKFSDAIKNLQKSLEGLKSVNAQLKALQDTFKGIGNIKTETPKSTPFIEEIATKQEKIQNKISKQRKEVEKLTASYVKLDNKQDKEGKRNLKNLKKARRELEKLNNEAKGSKQLSTIGKLFAAIGRVALYRAIRALLKEITQSAKEGLENIRQVDAGLDSSLKKISLAGTSIKNSFASVLSGIIQSIEPIITRITDGIARIMNRINEARAKVSGKTSFMKILTSDTEEYQKELKKAQKETGKLLSFDTFTTLATDNKSSYTGAVESPVEMTEDEAEGIVKTLNDVKIAIEAIGIAIAALALAKLFDKLSDIKGVLGKGVGITAILIGIWSIIDGIKGIMNWDSETSALKKVSDILKIVLGTVAAIAGMIFLIKGGALAGAIAAGAAIGSVLLMARSKTANYATGGQFQSADMFYANENGKTELIASNNNGGGAVMNLDQWASISYSSFYRALSDYNAAKDGGRGNIDMNQLGRAVASNSGFIGEINRRNTGVKLI